MQLRHLKVSKLNNSLRGHDFCLPLYLRLFFGHVLVDCVAGKEFYERKKRAIITFYNQILNLICIHHQ